MIAAATRRKEDEELMNERLDSTRKQNQRDPSWKRGTRSRRDRGKLKRDIFRGELNFILWEKAWWLHGKRNSENSDNWPAKNKLDKLKLRTNSHSDSLADLSILGNDKMSGFCRGLKATLRHATAVILSRSTP